MVSSDKEIQPKINSILDIFRYSTKGKLLRVLAWVQRLVSNLKGKVRIQSVNLEPQLNVPEIKHAETSLIQSIQSEAFKREIEYLSSASNKDKRAPIYVTQFNLFLDKDKLLRGRTRICKSSVIESGKHPILLPSRAVVMAILLRGCKIKILPTEWAWQLIEFHFTKLCVKFADMPVSVLSLNVNKLQKVT